MRLVNCQLKRTPMDRSRVVKEILSLGLVIIIGGAIYGGMQLLKDFNGKRAFAQTGLEPLTLAEAKALSSTTGKPILADLSAYWCTFCIKLDREVLADPRVNQIIREHYIFARIDSEAEGASEFRQQYQAFTYPTLLALKPSGELITKLPIVYEPGAFAHNLHKALKASSL